MRIFGHLFQVLGAQLLRPLYLYRPEAFIVNEGDVHLLM